LCGLAEDLGQPDNGHCCGLDDVGNPSSIQNGRKPL
jgi:hypothetical protein